MYQDEFMAPNKKDGKKGKPISFRFTQETIEQLKVLAKFNTRTVSNMVDALIEDAFRNLAHEHPDDVKRIEKDLRPKKK